MIILLFPESMQLFIALSPKSISIALPSPLIRTNSCLHMAKSLRSQTRSPTLISTQGELDRSNLDIASMFYFPKGLEGPLVICAVDLMEDPCSRISTMGDMVTEIVRAFC